MNYIYKSYITITITTKDYWINGVQLLVLFIFYSFTHNEQLLTFIIYIEYCITSPRISGVYYIGGFYTFCLHCE